MLAKLKQCIRWFSTTFTITYFRLIGSITILLLIFRKTEINAAPPKKELIQIKPTTAHAYISSVTINTIYSQIDAFSHPPSENNLYPICFWQPDHRSNISIQSCLRLQLTGERFLTSRRKSW